MAVDLDCVECKTDEHVIRVPDGALTGTERRLRCTQCGTEWVRGEPAPRKIALPSLDEIKSRFPRQEDVEPARLARAQVLKAEFLAMEPEAQPNVGPYWVKYQRIFSAEGLPGCDPQDLKDFANSNVGANPGNMSVFNDEWNRMGPEAGAARVRQVVEYLLRGDAPPDLEDRLTALINDTKAFGMKGFKESLLTKVLCIAYPDRFLTITKYTGQAGKREIARTIWGLELPDPERVTWTIGRLILWSNDLLLALSGDGFKHQQHAAEFLWWAKDRA